MPEASNQIHPAKATKSAPLSMLRRYHSQTFSRGHVEDTSYPPPKEFGCRTHEIDTGGIFENTFPPHHTNIPLLEFSLDLTMRQRIRISLIGLLAGASIGLAAHKPFRIQDDVLAFPQFEIFFADEYVLEADAKSRLARSPSPHHSNARHAASPSPSQSPISSSPASQHDQAELSQQLRIQPEGSQSNRENTELPSGTDNTIDSYEEMVLNDKRFLCGIPKVSPLEEDPASTPPAPDQEEKELMRATNRGLELLRDMEGKCLYYSAGWWSYSFCYKNQVRQFHALLPGNGVPVYPPAEDPAMETYVLGKFQPRKTEGTKKQGDGAASTEVATLQTKGESWYLVQHLEDGTGCDITGKDRKIEVQFHCHPQSPDHIAWIKEVTTCSYMMVIYTPRLCNDVAFQPPREDQANGIECREIISPEQIPKWEATRAARIKQELSDGMREQFPVVGDIQVGAMKLVGKDGKRIEKGRVVFGGEERIEILAKSEGGKIKRLSKEDLRKLNLEPEKVQSFEKELEEVAGGKDWRLELVEAANDRRLRGVTDRDEEEQEGQDEDGVEKPKKKQKQQRKKVKETEPAEGSEETFKEEL
ncbi:Protein OS-9 [Myotisia sp. PD_48]|nr:Protein OS-9 [Myotisia sp. PD_48]